ncbi:MAG: DUF2510 domain-containing protein [Tetrasphaera sp.]|nr:DUF2510 domain-containing protein [Tetrasphaera sp.]
MNAPAGWYPTPDGNERFWDGAAWTEQIRSPIAQTQAMPAPPPPPVATGSMGGGSYTTPGQGSVPPVTNPYATNPTNPYGGPAGGNPYGSPASGSRMNRGCLIAAIITAVLLVLGVGACMVAANRVFEAAKDVLPSLTASPAIPKPTPDGPASTPPPSAGPTDNPLTGTHEVEVRITGEGSGEIAWTIGDKSGQESATFPVTKKGTVEGLVIASVTTIPPVKITGPLTCEVVVDGAVVKKESITGPDDKFGLLLCFYAGAGK